MGKTFLDVKDHITDCYRAILAGDYHPVRVCGYIREMEEWDTDIPFIEALRALGIPEFRAEEQACFIILCHHIIHDGLLAVDFGQYCNRMCYDFVEEGKEKLLRRGFIRRVGNNSDTPERACQQRKRYLLSAPAFGMLFRGRSELLSVDDLSRQAEIVMAPTITPRQLFFNEVNRPDVERLEMLLEPVRFSSVMERLRSRGRKASVVCLLYGAPGTGKTELARQLARSTGRDLVVADAAKLFASFHGDTEKNVTELFETYRYLHAMTTNVPILLFNEADGFLGKRTPLMRQAVDKIENRVQNILLQALEEFEGIFIATTNLAQNIDPAFERRLLYKIRFNLPDQQTRTRIWRSMIPDMDPEEAALLASRYEFSGGQIDNIAKKRDIDEALLGSTPTLSTMLGYCDNELLESDVDVNLGKVDFGEAFFGHGGTMS